MGFNDSFIIRLRRMEYEGRFGKVAINVSFGEAGFGGKAIILPGIGILARGG
ncbi:MAG TPA: hypothetical protein ACFYD6_13600 [Candidatus Brocadiia bacterium]|nr:hypothetical protein [Candidatus Brocadiales bacterium]